MQLKNYDMIYTENSLNILTIRTFPQKGPAWINNHIRGNEKINEICKLLEVDEHEFQIKRNRIKHTILSLGNSVDGLIAIGDENFPELRGSVKPSDRPYALFYKGDISLLSKSNLNVAVIGVLNPDDKIELTEKILTEKILQGGATIVSGLALGCDTIAHKTALRCNGKTIAILPSPLNDVIPRENLELAHQILSHGGLLVSEYYEPPRGKNEIISRFVERDRLQAMFSDAIMLTASYALNNVGNDSGSRHAMEKAKLYGIKRGVVYNKIKHKDNPKFDLNRQLIADNSIIRIDSQNMNETIPKLLHKTIYGTNSLF